MSSNLLKGASSRQAAEAVRSRIDWKYALSLDLADPGFDFSILSKFRGRLLVGSAETTLLETMLERFKEHGLRDPPEANNEPTRPMSSQLSVPSIGSNVLGRRCVRRSMRPALVAPEWLREHVAPEWFDRYSTRIEDSRLPKGQEARSQYAELIGADGSRLLSAIYDPSALLHLRELPAVQALRQTWVFQYYAEEGQLRWRKAEDLPPAGLRFDSPYDPEARFGNKRSITWTGDIRSSHRNV